MNQVAFNFFIKTFDGFIEQGPVGHVPSEFARNVYKYNGSSLPVDLHVLSNTKLTRRDIFDIINSPNTFLFKIFSICSWGGMRQSNTGAYLFFRDWEKYCSELETHLNNLSYHTINRETGYAKIKELELSGCGPAFFTKFMCFFDPANCFIMDQWIAKSINILYRNFSPTVIFSGDRVSPNNTAQIYDLFCSRIISITNDINTSLNESFSPLEVEERLFSKGGRRPHDWREYVINNWR